MGVIGLFHHNTKNWAKYFHNWVLCSKLPIKYIQHTDFSFPSSIFAQYPYRLAFNFINIMKFHSVRYVTISLPLRHIDYLHACCRFFCQGVPNPIFLVWMLQKDALTLGKKAITKKFNGTIHRVLAWSVAHRKNWNSLIRYVTKYFFALL